MAFCTYNSETSCILDFVRKLDVGTTAGHICCDGHCRWLTGMLYDLSLACMLLGIEDLMLDAAQAEHTAQEL